MKHLKYVLPVVALLMAGCGNKETETPPPAATPSEKPSAAVAPTNSATAVAPTNQPATNTNEVAVIKTTDGTMVIQFWTDAAPQTIANFKKLARAGFYDGTCFHRIIKGFMIQGGDPKTKDLSKKDEWGTGDPGYTIPDEKNDHKHVRGTIAMGNTGRPNSAGCQFYICLEPQPGLDERNYTTFGQLIKGDDVLQKIGDTPVGPSPRGEMSVPTERVEVTSITIVPASSVQ